MRLLPFAILSVLPGLHRPNQCGLRWADDARRSRHTLANAPFTQGLLSKDEITALKDELVFERAVQSYLWALPALNMSGMKEGSAKVFGKGYNILPIYVGHCLRVRPWRYFIFEVPSNLITALDCPHHDHLGPFGRRHRLGHGVDELCRRAISAGRSRGRVLPGDRSLFHLLVSEPPPCLHRFGLPDWACRSRWWAARRFHRDQQARQAGEGDHMTDIEGPTTGQERRRNSLSSSRRRRRYWAFCINGRPVVVSKLILKTHTGNQSYPSKQNL